MHIKEIFYSFQGEGPWVGYPQIFIRLYGCNIHCAYCDEPDFIEDRHNYTVDQVIEAIQPFLAQHPHSISITGGEPLIQSAHLKTLLPQLPLPIYLETNGTLPLQLAEVKDLVTYFAVDFKSGFEEPFAAFMMQLKDKPNVFVKYVLIRDFPSTDIAHAAQITASINPSIPFVIQPVTPFAQITQKANPEDILRGYSEARRYLHDVRIIPQTHKFIGLQ